MPGQYALHGHPINGDSAATIAAAIADGVRSGALPPATPLPAVRALAQRLGVNHNTVAAAYRQLRDRGVVETAGRRGTRVRDVRAAAERPGAWAPSADGVRDLVLGNPDPALLPAMAPHLARLAQRGGDGWADDGLDGYGAPEVLPELAAFARRRLAAAGLDGSRLTLASGAMDGIERALSALLRPGDRVVVEDPGWHRHLDLVVGLGLVPVPVPVDDEGLMPDALAEALRSAAAVLLTPRAQNPLGAALTVARAEELRAVLAKRPEVLVVEDDHAQGVAGAPLRSLAADPGASRRRRGHRVVRWLHVASMSKAYGPELRLAVVCGDPATVAAVQDRIRLGPGWVSRVLQRLTLAMWTDEGVAAAVEAAERAYARRRAAVVAALAEHGLRAHGVSGLNVWVPVPDETAAVAGLLAAGWAVSPGARFRSRTPSAIRLTVASLPPEDAPALASAVAAAVRSGRVVGTA